MFKEVVGSLIAIVLVVFVPRGTLLAQPRLKCSPDRVYQIAKMDDRNGRLNPTVKELLDYAAGQEEMIKARLFEGLATEADFKAEYELAIETSTAIKKADPEYYQQAVVRGVAIDSISKAKAFGDLTHLYVFGSDVHFAGLKVSQEQANRLNELSGRFEKASRKNKRVLADKLRTLLSSRFYGLRDLLDQKQWDIFRTMIGEPLTLLDSTDLTKVITQNEISSSAIGSEKRVAFVKKVLSATEFQSDENGSSIDITILTLLLSIELDLGEKEIRQLERSISMRRLGMLSSPFDPRLRISQLLKNDDVYPLELQEILNESQQRSLSQMEIQLRHRDIFDFGLGNEKLRHTVGLNEANSARVLNYAAETERLWKIRVAEFQKRQIELVKEAYSEAFKQLDAKQMVALCVNVSGQRKTIADLIVNEAVLPEGR